MLCQNMFPIQFLFSKWVNEWQVHISSHKWTTSPLHGRHCLVPHTRVSGWRGCCKLYTNNTYEYDDNGSSIYQLFFKHALLFFFCQCHMLSNTDSFLDMGNGVWRENLVCHMYRSERGANRMPGSRKKHRLIAEAKPARTEKQNKASRFLGTWVDGKRENGLWLQFEGDSSDERELIRFCWDARVCGQSNILWLTLSS